MLITVFIIYYSYLFFVMIVTGMPANSRYIQIVPYPSSDQAAFACNRIWPCTDQVTCSIHTHTKLASANIGPWLMPIRVSFA